MSTTTTVHSLAALPEDERTMLVTALLDYFPADRKLPSFGLRERAPFSNYDPRVISALIVSLRMAGLLDQTGSSRDAAYSLTPAGILVRDQRRAAS